jgi:hypothetical protein
MSRFPNVQFMLSVAAPPQFPPDQGAEVAFAGRSNAGKSSAINAITERKALAMLFQHVAIAAVAHVDAPDPAVLGRDHRPAEAGAGAPRHARQPARRRRRHPRAAHLGRGRAAFRCRHHGRAEGARRLRRAAREHRHPGQHLGLPRLPRALHGAIVARQPQPADTCQNFDVGNACLAFLNGMDIAARMIERGDIDYALIVDGEAATRSPRRPSRGSMRRTPPPSSSATSSPR